MGQPFQQFYPSREKINLKSKIRSRHDLDTYALLCPSVHRLFTITIRPGEAMERHLVHHHGPSNCHFNVLFHYTIRSVYPDCDQLATYPRQMLAYETAGHLRMDRFRHVI